VQPAEPVLQVQERFLELVPAAVPVLTRSAEFPAMSPRREAVRRLRLRLMLILIVLSLFSRSVSTLQRPGLTRLSFTLDLFLVSDFYYLLPGLTQRKPIYHKCICASQNQTMRSATIDVRGSPSFRSRGNNKIYARTPCSVKTSARKNP
jgi:hypothetical protein